MTEADQYNNILTPLAVPTSLLSDQIKKNLKILKF